MAMNNCGASEEQPGNENDIIEIQRLLKLRFAEEKSKASQQLQPFNLAKEHSANRLSVVMRPRLRRQKKIRYDKIDIFSR